MKITNLPNSLKLLSVVLGLVGFTTVAQAQLINIAGDAAPIMGINNLYTTANDNGDTTEYNYSNNGYGWVNYFSPNASNVTDGDLTTYNHTEYDGGLPTPLNQHFDSSYVGVDGAGLLTAASTSTHVHHAIAALTVVFALDPSGVGGWFGNNGSNNNPLTAVSGPGSLIAPQMQITTDGMTWTNIGSTSNYISLMTGVDPNSGTSPLITFTLDTPTSNIEGIRLIGLDAGRGNGQGYLGVRELDVMAGEVPEPSTYAMMLAGVGVLFVVQRMRNKQRA